MKDVFAQPQYAAVVEFPRPRERRRQADADAAPAPTETVGADGGAHRGRRRREIAVPSGLEGKLEADATAAVVNAGLRRERGLGAVRHRDVRPRHPGRPEGRHDARARGARSTLVVSSGPKAQPTQQPAADGRRPTADAGSPLILGEGRPPAPRRSFQAPARPQPISAVAPGRVA